MSDRPTRVLIVEDDVDTASCFADALAGRFSVSTIESPREAIEACKRHELGAVVTDLDLPEMTGLELITQLKAARPRLPVILVTGHAAVSTAVDAMERGASYVLTKPCGSSELRSVVEDAVRAGAREDTCTFVRR